MMCRRLLSQHAFNGSRHRLLVPGKSNLQSLGTNIRSMILHQRLNHFKSKAENLMEKGYDIFKNIRQPYRSLLIFFVGKSRCAEAVENLKEITCCLANLLSRQCKVHTSQKVHQALQIYSFYSRIWGEEMTRRMVTGIRKSLLSRGKMFLLSAVCIVPYDWSNNKIQDESLENSVVEYETVADLCRSTIFCEDCEKRQVIDKVIQDNDYCMCGGSVAYTDRSRHFDNWEPFLERENILVWRRQHRVDSNLYAYKVFGKYEDMSLSSFMEVQLNASFRTEWDSNALELRVLSSHPESNSDLLYWLVKFPHFFANRDYVFKRRYRVNEEKKEVVILNEVTEHPQLQEEKGVYRVKEYWSKMVLRANKDFNEPGMSYTLTYFDNPGTSLPTPVTNFVASTAFPDFLCKVYKSAMSLQQRWENGEDVYVTLPPLLRYRRRSLEVFIPQPEAEGISGAVVPLNDSVQTETSKLSQLRIIKEAIMDEDNVDEASKINYKIPLRFRKAVIDLLEAIEVVSPVYEEKTVLTAKIESLVDKLGLDKVRKNKLVKKLQAIGSKTKSFINNAAKKKEESFKIMNEFERRKHYYDQLFPDENSLIMLKDLLQAINEVLKADNNMRTGKSFKETEPERTSKEPKPNNENSNEDYSESSSAKDKESTSERGQKSHTEELHPVDLSCNCKSSSTSTTTENSAEPWYYFGFVTALWSSENKDTLQPCACTQKLNKEGDGASQYDSHAVQKNIAETSTSSSWYLYIWGLFVSKASVSAENPQSNGNASEAQPSERGTVSSDD